MVKLTEDMKRFISTKHMEEQKTTTEILREFGDSFGFLPSATTVNKYQSFNETNPPKDEIPEEEEEEGIEGTITAKKKDTRLQPEMLDISDGIEEEDIKRLARTIEKSNQETFDLLAKAFKKGYTKVDMSTGEVEK